MTYNALIGVSRPTKDLGPKLVDGTRVHHRRYSWMVGHVVSNVAQGDHVMVLWDHIGGPCAELPTDLRATPVQP